MKYVFIRISTDLAARIDRQRELLPRQRHMRWLLERALKAEERRGAKR
jgi:hypothetical protein